MIYVGDLVESMVMAMEKVKSYSVFNVGFGRGYKVKDLLKKICALDGYKGCRIVFDPSKPQMIPVRRVDLAKIRKNLGFFPRTTLEDGIRRTIAWYRENPL